MGALDLSLPMQTLAQSAVVLASGTLRLVNHYGARQRPKTVTLVTIGQAAMHYDHPRNAVVRTIRRIPSSQSP